MIPKRFEIHVLQCLELDLSYVARFARLPQPLLRFPLASHLARITGQVIRNEGIYSVPVAVATIVVLLWVYRFELLLAVPKAAP